MIAGSKAFDFTGTRTRFQRLKDCKLFNGWIEKFHADRVMVKTESPGDLAADQDFRFEAFGNGTTASFVAKVESVMDHSPSASGLMEALPSGTRFVVFKISTALRFSESSEAARHKVKDIPVCLILNQETISAAATDVSIGGIGAICGREIPAGMQLTVAIQTPLGAISATAESRYCRPENGKPGMYRVGLMFLEMNRVAKPKWERYVGELL